MGKAEDKKRSEAAKKAAATRKRNQQSEDDESQQDQLQTDDESQPGDAPVTPNQPEPSPNQDEGDEGDVQSPSGFKDQQRGVQPSDVIELDNHRADVNPGDQQAQHRQQETERAVDRAVHLERTAGRQTTHPLRTAGRRIGKGAKTTNPTTSGRVRG